MDKYIWDNWLPKLASNDRIMTDVNFGKPGSSTTPFSDMLGFACLSERKASSIELMTGNPTPLSDQMRWPLLNDALGEGRVELKTDDPTPLSSRMGWSLLSKRKYYGISETSQ